MQGEKDSMQGEEEEDYALRGEGELSAIHERGDAWERDELCAGELGSVYGRDEQIVRTRGNIGR